MKAASKTEPDQPDTNRRYLMIGGGALGVAAVGGLAYYNWKKRNPSPRGQTGPVPVDALMAPGSLPDVALGNADAPVTIVEYAALTCSHCANFHETTLPLLKTKYIETGKVRWILRSFPLNPLDVGAFMLTRCAGTERYYPLVEVLFQFQRDWAFSQQPLPALYNLVKQAGYSEQSFKACLGDQKMLESVEQMRERASKEFGVSSTPTFFINGERKVGAISPDELDALMAPHLKTS
jgi:protein-disulfide isomerase